MPGSTRSMVGPMGRTSTSGSISAMSMLLEHTGQEAAGQHVAQAIQSVTGTKMKSQAAGKMGYGTTEVGDLVVAAMRA